MDSSRRWEGQRRPISQLGNSPSCLAPFERARALSRGVQARSRTSRHRRRGGPCGISNRWLLSLTRKKPGHSCTPSDLEANVYDCQIMLGTRTRPTHLRLSSRPAFTGSWCPRPVPCGLTTSHSIPFSSTTTSAPSLDVRNIAVARPLSLQATARSAADLRGCWLSQLSSSGTGLSRS